VLPNVGRVITTDATMIVCNSTKRNTLGRVRTMNIWFYAAIKRSKTVITGNVFFLF
jgi:hypothetical protein